MPPGHLRDISGTSPGHLRDISGTSPGHSLALPDRFHPFSYISDKLFSEVYFLCFFVFFMFPTSFLMFLNLLP